MHFAKTLSASRNTRITRSLPAAIMILKGGSNGTWYSILFQNVKIIVMKQLYKPNQEMIS